MTFESYSILGKEEPILLINKDGKQLERIALVDTGSASTKISMEIAAELNLTISGEKQTWSVDGNEKRVYADVMIKIGENIINTTVGVADMSSMKHDVMLGRKDIEAIQALVDVSK